MQKKIGVYFGSSLGFALILSFFSLFQKRLLGIQEISLEFKAFAIPILFGGLAGLAIAIIYVRLENKSAQLEDYLDHIDNLVQILSIDKRFLYVNKAWRDALQYSPEEVKKLTLADIMHPECGFR
ncbi:MAG: hypothetical protein HN855_02930 [Anaerolineae bacterium]|jgi:PAS domain-containing protein|nr:hypothetical protein [Anaerolineae bacterium]MBT7072154.1 hypothetical protein [Anaerolineae bacterium]MBT7324092.1 hypothetical protein [Anaerolineae bacterium]